MLHKRIVCLLWPTAARPCPRRPYSTPATPSHPSVTTAAAADHDSPTTHFRITLLRSAIALPKRYKGTLVALGIHRRMQTVYHSHKPDIAGKILRVKELVEVQNVPASSVRTKTEQRWERRPKRGFEVVRTLKDRRW